MVLWPPRSPDFTRASFYLWRHLKGRIYSKSFSKPNDFRLMTEAAATTMSLVSSYVHCSVNCWRNKTFS